MRLDAPERQPAKRRLTDLAVGRMRLPLRGSTRVEVFDDLLPGFGPRVSSKRTKSFFVFCRVQGRQRRLGLGRWPKVRVAEARQAARKALERAQVGDDPAAVNSEKRRAARYTVGFLVADYVGCRRT